jgi:hypothetical protein
MMADKIDIDSHNEQIEKKAEDHFKNLPRHQLALSRKDEVVHIDPTRVYEHDFWSSEEDASGNSKWVKSVRAGDEVNWLEYNPSPMPVYFIFDYLSSTQRDLARAIVDLDTPFLKVIFIGGDLKAANEDLKYPLTYLNNTMIREYDIKYTPIVVRRGVGEYRNNYRKRRFNVDEVTIENVIKEINGE